MRFCRSAFTASNVLSRDVRPVPPVSTIAWTSGCASWRSTMPRTSSGSSFTIVRPATSCPAAVSSSAIAAPLVSVSGVRVSLTVMMKQRTDCGARALCSAWLTRAIVARGACYDSRMRRRGHEDAKTGRRLLRALLSLRVVVVVCVAVTAAVVAAAPRDPFVLDRAGERWVEQTLKTLTPDEKIGQLIVPAFDSNYIGTDSDTYDTLTRLVRDYHVSGFLVFGASIPAPSVLLNPGYGTVILGQPL